MLQRTWQVTLEGEPYQIDLTVTFWSGQRVVKVNGQTIIDLKQVMDYGSVHYFPIGSHLCALLIKFKYLAVHDPYLLVDGVLADTGEPIRLNSIKLMNHRIWPVELEDGPHRIEVLHLPRSGTVRVLVDGQVQVKDVRFLSEQSHTVQVGRHTAVVQIAKREREQWYDLLLDGLPATVGAPARAEAAAASEVAAAAAPEAAPVAAPPTFEEQWQADVRKAEKDIKSGWIAGLLVGGVTLLLHFLLAGSTLNGISFGPSGLVGALVLLGLTVGVYFKSRACAVLLFGLFVVDKLIGLLMAPRVPGIVMTAAIAVYLWAGVRGTFKYHKLTS